MIVRMVLRREPLAYDGEEFALPYRGAGLDRPGQGRCARSCIPTPTSRSGSPPAGRPTPRSRPRSPTAGCRWASVPTDSRCTATRSTPASPAAIRRARPFEIFAPCNVEITDDVARRDRRQEAAHRDVRRRHGQRHAQLPPRGDGPRAASPRPRPHPRAVDGRTSATTPSPPSPTSTSSSHCSRDHRIASTRSGSTTGGRPAG